MSSCFLCDVIAAVCHCSCLVGCIVFFSSAQPLSFSFSVYAVKTHTVNTHIKNSKLKNVQTEIWFDKYHITSHESPFARW